MFGARGDTDHISGPTLGQDLRILDGIASWCGALHGSMPLSEALKSLTLAIGAEAAIVSRDARSEGKCRVVAEYDTRSQDQTIETIKRAFAQDVLGDYFNRVRGGTIWFLSDHEDDFGFEMTSGLSSWRITRGVVDVIVVALESTGIQHDYLEFHFTRELRPEEKSDTEQVFPTLVRAWGGRQTGLVTQAQMDERMIRARALADEQRIKPDAPILGVSNPAKLSRAEFRVCLLLSRGLSVKGVTEELGLSEATTRSHLRSIYSKTNTSGLAELLYRILSVGQDQSSDIASRFHG